MEDEHFSIRRPRHADLGSIPYFVTTRTFASRRVFSGNLAAVAVEQLLSDRERYGFLLPAFVFMPDHAHFVIVPAAPYSISHTMRIVKGSIARRINKATGQRGRLWQEGFFDKAPRTRDDVNTYIDYIHGNSVKAGMVARPEDYAYSSASGRGMSDYQRFFEEERE